MLAACGAVEVGAQHDPGGEPLRGGAVVHRRRRQEVGDELRLSHVRHLAELCGVEQGFAEVPHPRLGGPVVGRFHLQQEVADLRRAGGVGGALPQHKGRHIGAVGGGAVRMNRKMTRGAALLDDVLAHLELRQGPHLGPDA